MDGKFRNGEIKYDERQTAVRGRAFKWAYATLLVALALYAVTDGLWDWCVPVAGCTMAISASLVPFLLICIFGEAYWWTDTGRKGQYVTSALLGLSNLAVAGAAAANGELVEDGRLQIGAANLSLGAVFILVLIATLIQRARLKRGGEDE